LRQGDTLGQANASLVVCGSRRPGIHTTSREGWPYRNRLPHSPGTTRTGRRGRFSSAC